MGTTLGDFKITGVVGEGGFGIVYLAYEAALDRTVAIKEYLPSSIAGRTGNQSVMVRSQLNTNAFASGLKNFLREAQLLARFSHPAMVEVHRVWEQNSTAYMAMRFYPGKTLRELRQSATEFDELSIRRILEPVFDALTLLHAQNVIHRDVSPDNILMRGNGAPVLLDLGAARMVIGGMTQALTTVLKPGYAPIEQYVDDGTMHQGPWTDVYGLGAVLYFLLIGSPPPQAVARMITDPLKDIAGKSTIKVAPMFTDAVVKALAVRPENRFQSVDELRDALGWTEPLPELRTSFVKPESIAALKAGAGPKTQPPGAVRPTTSPVAPPVPGLTPLDRVFTQDNEATVVWKGPPITGNPPAVAPTPFVPTPPPPPISAPKPQPRAATPAPAAAAATASERPSITPSKSFEESKGSGAKPWMFAAAALIAAAAAGYYFLMGKPAAPTPAVAEPTAATTATAATNPGSTTSPTAPVVTPPQPAKVDPAPAATTVVPPVKPAPEPVKPVDTKKAETDAEALAKTKREADEKAKLRLETQEKAAKAKQEADDRLKARAKVEAEERAAAAARAEQEERARKARQEEEERVAAAKAKADADKQNKLTVTAAATSSPATRRSVDELSAAGASAFRRGEVSTARAAWNELVGHPDATARSKAIAFNNLAVSYCQASDESNCERMYVSMFRADRNYGLEAQERDLPQFKRAYDRAARAVRAQY